MSDLPDITRQTAHALLSTLAAMHAAPEATNPAVHLGARRLMEIGAVTAALDDDGGVEIDLSYLMSAAALTTEWLIEHLAAVLQVEHDEVVGRLRRFLDHEA
jgi:hypothetical protein